MKTIETIKQEFKAATGYNMPIYTYNGKLGVLYDVDCVPEFIQMDEFLARPSVNYDDVRWVTVGADGCEEGEEITDAAVRNDENDEKILVACVWSPVDYNKSDEYVRELLVTTTKYYDWKSERRSVIDALQQDLDKYSEQFADAELEDDSEERTKNIRNKFRAYLMERRKDWEKTCAQYEDPEGWEEFSQNKADFSSVLGEALDGYYYDGTHEAIAVATDYLTEIKDE